MITLRTGLPRSGKTHSSTAELAQLMKYWDTEAGSKDRRRVYANINGLTLPHDPLPIADEVFDAKGELISFTIVWAEIEDGSLVIVDEVQRTFGGLPIGRKEMPPHYVFLNTHGHRGLDLWFITQHPKLLDMTVRRLVGKHLHYRKNSLKPKWFAFAPDAITYEWDHCEDGLQGLKHAVMGTYSYNRKISAQYVSATEHRTPEFSRPFWVYVPFIMLPAAAYVLWAGWPTLVALLGGGGADLVKGAPKVAPKLAAAPAAAGTIPDGPVENIVLPTKGVAPAPASPAADAGGSLVPGTAPARSEPVFMGCARLSDFCRCYDQHAQVFEKPADFCRDQTTKPTFAKARAVDMSRVKDLAPVAPPAAPAEIDMIEWSRKHRLAMR